MISARETFRLGNERLLRHCSSVSCLCSSRPSAVERLEAAVGPRQARLLIGEVARDGRDEKAARAPA